MIKLIMALCLLSFAVFRCSSNDIFDLCITGGTIIDGTGNASFRGDVFINGDRIVVVRKAGETTPEAKTVIDASGLCIAPGFIDAHSHSDYTLLVDGLGQSKIRQGVTTEIIGESASAGPVLGHAVVSVNRELQRLGLKLEWKTLGEYFEHIQKSKIALNIASHVAVGQIRDCVIGEINRKPTATELETMKQLVAEAMEQGAIGLSTGLIYTPDIFATTEELIELATVAARYGGIYSAHIRSEDDKLLEALDETITISQKARIPAHVFHMKASKQANWHLMEPAIQKVNKARAEGIPLTADMYPYVASYTTLNTILPDWAIEGGIDSIVARLKNPVQREKVRKSIENEKYGYSSYKEFFTKIMISEIPGDINKNLEGRIIWDIVQEKKVDPINYILDLLIQENAQISVIFFTMSEENKFQLFPQPWICIGSDGSAICPEGVLGKGKPHPRYYGTFPRVLSYYVREHQLVSLEEAIRKMTSLPADIYHLTDRGMLKAGKYADIVVFDKDKIKDNSTFENPPQYSTGVEYLIVNGEVVISKGEPTGTKPGRVLYGAGKKM